MVGKHFTAGFKYNDLQETHTDILHPVTPIWGISVIYWTFESSVWPWRWLVCFSVEMFHIKSCLGGDTVAMCDMRKWGVLICVPIYNEAVRQSTWCSSLTLLYLVSTLSYLWQSTEIRRILMMVENLKDLRAGILYWKDITNVGLWEREVTGNVRSLSPPQYAQRVRISQNIYTRSRS